jgi:hypothetical protein
VAVKRSITAKDLTGKPWSQLPVTEMGPAVQRMIASRKSEESGRRVRYRRNLELYERRKWNDYGTYTDGASEDFERDRLGLIRSAVSTAVSTVYAPQKPKPQFQTTGATWAIRRRAYKLDRVCEGIINQRQGRWINVWALMTDAGCETAVQGVACIKVLSDMANKRIAHKLIPAPDIYFDPTEGREPRNMWHREPISQTEALRLWPKAKSAIMGAQPYEWLGGKQSKPRETTTIELQYAYSLPSSSDEPGKWCAVIGGEVVDSGDWDAPSFPIVMLGWEPHREGPWFSGLVDEGAGQAEFCSELHLRLRYRVIVASGKKIYYPRDTVKPDDLTGNDAVTGIAYEGSQPPIESVTPPFTQTETEFLQMCIQNFWDSIGISQVSAAARREQGVQSGIAMMTLNDTKAGRQLVKAQRYEQAYVDLAHQYVWRLRELAAEHPDLIVQFAGKKLIREIKWTDADVEDDMFSVTVGASSALPHDPAGRQQMVSEMFQQGIISQETTKTLIGWPDLDNELNLETSVQEYVDALIERYLNADAETWKATQYQAPEGHLPNKPAALLRFASALYKARTDQMTLPPEESAKAEFNCNLLIRWIQEMDALMNPPAPAVAGGGAAGAPTLPAGPLPPGALPPPAPGNLPPGMAPPPPVPMGAAA